MGAVQRKLKESWTVEEYLDFEQASPVRHEYVDGQLYAMAGASRNHNRVMLDLAGWFNDHLGGSSCEAFAADIKVKVGRTRYYYPDVLVTCTPLIEGEDDYIVAAPVLIVEILSSSTKRTDRIEKMREYRNLPGLREYVLVHQDVMRVEIYRHSAPGEEWQPEIYADPEAEVRFESIGLSAGLRDIYRRVKFSEEAGKESE